MNEYPFSPQPPLSGQDGTQTRPPAGGRPDRAWDISQIPPPAPEPPDPNRPLWQAVIGPPTEGEWRQTRPRRLTFICWAYALAAVLCLYFSTSAFDFSPVLLFGLSVPRAVLFLPLHAVLIAVSLAAFIRNITTFLWCERDAWETARLLEAPGRLVTVYCDRITAQGEFDVVTVPLSGAVVCEYPTLLTVSQAGQSVTVRGADVSPAQLTALSALLVSGGAKRMGRIPTAGFPYATAARTAPTLRAPKPLFSAPFSLNKSDVFAARLSGFFRRQWLVWTPLMCLCALVLTDCLPEGKYFWLFYGLIFLSVIAFSVLIPTLALFWDTMTDRTLPKNGRWDFYPDRLLIVTGQETRRFPRQLAAMSDEGRSVELHLLGEGESWPKSAFIDYTAMAAFVGIVEKPARGKRRGKAG